MRILLIENDPRWISRAQHQFRGHAMTVVSDCAGATDISPANYDLILTDVNLPVGDPDKHGLEICERFKGQSFPGGLVVALSAVLRGVPCVVVTDTTAHNDVMACMIEYLCSESRSLFKNNSVYFETRSQEKDWLAAVRNSPWSHYFDT